MAKKTTSKNPVSKKEKVKPGINFRGEFKANLLKANGKWTEADVDAFLDKSLVGKAALKAYTKLHG